jgi:hypothetical protein
VVTSLGWGHAHAHPLTGKSLEICNESYEDPINSSCGEEVVLQ